MFTLKHYSSGGNYTVYEATEYRVEEIKGLTPESSGKVILYKPADHDPSLINQPAIPLGMFEHVYVTNSDGKTIDHIRGPEPVEEPMSAGSIGIERRYA